MSGTPPDHDDLETRLQALRSAHANRRGKQTSRRGAVVLASLLVVGVLGTAFFIYASATGSRGGSPVKVEISSGDTLSAVAENLDRAGVVESAFAFKLEARLADAGTEIKPGEYEFQPGTDSGEILDQITTGKAPPTFTVVIPEGLTLEQTARRVARQSDIPSARFEAAARDANYGYAFLDNPAIGSTEGFLFPKKYEFVEGSSARQVVNRLLEQYFLETQNVSFAKVEGRPALSEYEILTVASLIERESANSEERRLISSVIYNRLREGMRLQIDATIQYALGEPKEELSLRDLEVDSPYNTYRKDGLPPGPICSPSLESIEAALDPAKTDYLYYVLNAGGERHSFTATYDEFLQKKAAAGR